ncbi:hypothetical protein BGZ83_008538 [Gryganskiella cystojenkinii]|nr:hypothetical protein BGZ83_008538 [Gryganskiella cystojenkinii]
MHKSILALLSSAVLASVSYAAATYTILVQNNGLVKGQYLFEYGVNTRICWCLKNTQTAAITGINGGNIKVFSTSDCTGNFATISPNGVLNNAQWVNSVSFGASGVSSTGPDSCPNYYT